MFGGSFYLAILSDPLALHRAKRFWWSGYAIAGVCELRVILFAAPRRFCLIAAIASWAVCFGQPEISGAVQVKGVPHRGIGIAQSRKRRLQISLPPRFLKPAGFGDGGLMTGGRSHNPVTVVTTQGNPGWPCWHRPCRPQYPPARSPL